VADVHIALWWRRQSRCARENMVEELARLYMFKPYGNNSEYSEVMQTMHNLVEMWASGCYRMSNPTEAAYVLAAAWCPRRRRG